MGGALAVAAMLTACAQMQDPAAEWSSYVAFAKLSGLMRTERDPQDAKFSPAVLAQNFRKLGFSFESDPFGTGETREGPQHIRKWRQPIRYTVHAEPADQQRLDRIVTPFAEELADLTQHSIERVDPEGPEGQTLNMMIIFPRDDILQQFLDTGPSGAGAINAPFGFGGEAAEVLRETLEPWYGAESPCAGQIWETEGNDENGAGELLFALVMIRPEIPDLLLKSCVEEELAQTLGLFNDDSSIRPTIFNDDQEFALLTQHDGLLLQILYDDRLETGMTPARAMPIVREIAGEVWWASRDRPES